mmetsp:Transcript_2389/g.4881  ORF Transcript_2389/g.4881 Transcript_2389/m.4881 type:complete len:130 (+) Transcript_2389:955-1344(+)
MDRKHFELTEECGVKFGTLATGKYYYNFPVGIAAQSGKEGGEAVFAGDGDVTVIESFADFDAGGVGGFFSYDKSSTYSSRGNQGCADSFGTFFGTIIFGGAPFCFAFGIGAIHAFRIGAREAFGIGSLN